MNDVGLYCTKRIQHARGWCATVKRDCANCIHLSRLSGGPGPQFFWEASHATLQQWLGERQLLAGVSLAEVRESFSQYSALLTLSVCDMSDSVSA